MEIAVAFIAKKERQTMKSSGSVEIGGALLGLFLFTGQVLASGPTLITSCGTTITKSGAYALTGNLTATSNRLLACIIVNANFVTIDLQGFTINCNSSAVHGILANDHASTQGLVVRNGFITDCDDGVSAPSSSPNISHQGSLIQNIVAINNGRIGVFVDQGSTVEGCVTSHNLLSGLGIGCPSNVLGTTAIGNGTRPATFFGTGCNMADNLLK